MPRVNYAKKSKASCDRPLNIRRRVSNLFLLSAATRKPVTSHATLNLSFHPSHHFNFFSAPTSFQDIQVSKLFPSQQPPSCVRPAVNTLFSPKDSVASNKTLGVSHKESTRAVTFSLYSARARWSCNRPLLHNHGAHRSILFLPAQHIDFRPAARLPQHFSRRAAADPEHIRKLHYPRR